MLFVMVRRLRYRVEIAGSDMVSSLKDYLGLLGADYNVFIGCKPYIYWIGDLGIMSCRGFGARYERVSVVYSGECIGFIIDGKPYLSTQLYEEIYRYIGGYRAALIASEHGVKAFLYGNDLFASSIKEYYEPLDNPVAVIDPLDNRVVGVAEPILHGENLFKALRESMEKPVYRNIYDLGLYIRLFE